MKIHYVQGIILLTLAGVQTASASLILETYQQLSGTGLGTVPTIVTFQANGSETGCVGQGGNTGSALVSGVCSAGGDTKTGASQSLLEPLSAAGIPTGATGASDFELIFNAVQPAGGSLAVTNITASFYSPTGVFLYQTSGLFCQNSAGSPMVPSGTGGCLLTATGQGTGNSGFAVTLDPTQLAAAVAAGAFSNTGNLVGVSSSAGTTAAPSAGGSETIFLANASTTGGGVTQSLVPEPGTYVLMGIGIGLLIVAKKGRFSD